MKSIELNEERNFKSWPSELINELKSENTTTKLGNVLLFESETMKLWNVILFPGERLPFRMVNCNFSFVSITDGVVLTRFGNGRIDMHHLEIGDTRYIKLENTNTICDLENIGDNILVIQLSEFKCILNQTFSAIETILNR